MERFEEFREIGLNEELIRALEVKGFNEPTEIQAKTIPLVLEGKDILGGSATGSGKTLAYLAGILQNTVKNGGVQSLILAPTRELAIQVADAVREFSRYNPLRVCTVYGGVSINNQIIKLRTSEVVVGTPGRIIDHLERRTLDLKNVKTLVLDEADVMLDMGFVEAVEKIIYAVPKPRQTLLFSATISNDIERISSRHMDNPVKISGQRLVDPTKLSQVYYDVTKQLKFSLLVHLLKEEETGLAMVFCNTQRNTDFVAKNLKANGIRALAIHGGLTQARRSERMEMFHSKNFDVLVCTDVAARGLDIKGVTCVVNYDIPNDSKQYLHRVGRTARAGMAGKSYSLLSEIDHENFSRVLHTNKVVIKRVETPLVERVKILAKDFSNNNFGRRKGGNSNRNSSRQKRSESSGSGGSGSSSHGPKTSGNYATRRRGARTNGRTRSR